jgi:hypothetical protein
MLTSKSAGHAFFACCRISTDSVRRDQPGLSCTTPSASTMTASTSTIDAMSFSPSAGDSTQSVAESASAITGSGASTEAPSTRAAHCPVRGSIMRG